MARVQEITQGIRVEVLPEYLPKESAPQDFKFVFAYHISILNLGSREVQLLNRHWLITDGEGEVREVRGPGVVGEQPILPPGGSHRYTSFCPLDTPTGSMQGSFEMIDDQGTKFEVKIPRFVLRDQQIMH